MKLRLRLLFWYTVVLAVSGCALSLTIYLFSTHRLYRAAEGFLRDESEVWLVASQDLLHDLPALQRRVRVEAGIERRFPIVYRLHNTRTGKDLVTGGEDELLAALPRELQPLLKEVDKEFTDYPVGDGHRLLHVLTRPVDAVKHPDLVLQTGLYTERIGERVRRLRLFLVTALIAALAVGVAGGKSLASRSLKPIDDLSAELQRIDARDLAARLAVSETEDEIAQLRADINGMLDRLEDAFDHIKGFTADAAHELRTPLAALQCSLEVALNSDRTPEEYRDVLAQALNDAASLSRTVQDLLLLARTDANIDGLTSETICIGPVIRELCEAFSAAAEAKGVSFTLQGAGECTCSLEANPELLKRLFGNLIDNAVQYTNPGGSITISGEVNSGVCTIRVTDTGVGISDEHQERIFERFFRTDRARSRREGGAGIGLNLCRSIITLYGGSISVKSKVGVGSTFEVHLPVKPHA